MSEIIQMYEKGFSLDIIIRHKLAELHSDEANGFVQPCDCNNQKRKSWRYRPDTGNYTKS